MIQFQGGQLKKYYENWKKYTKDHHILNIIKEGLRLDFEQIPFQSGYRIHPRSESETNIIIAEVTKLLKKGVIVKSKPEVGDFVSGVFTRDKKDNTKRMILNLKNLNSNVYYKHFKMESIQDVINIIEPNVYMASIDLKDAFYSVPIYICHQRFLKFFINGYYKFVCMPNGYDPAMRVFTKISKVPFTYLRKKGHLSVVYVDDSYLQGKTYQECLNNIRDSISILQELGFTIHPTKSSLIPKQNINFLGFDIDSRNMTISLTFEKKMKIKKLCTNLCTMKIISIRDLASVIGNLVASFPAVPYGPLFYRYLEHDKSIALKHKNFNFEAYMTLSQESIQELQWWIENIEHSFRSLNIVEPDLVIYTDASMSGWGVTDKIKPSGGFWHKNEIKHINVLELKAVFYGIKIYCENKTYKHVKVMCDNTTAVSYINHMGGQKSIECNKQAKEIWEWCISKNVWISAAHIPGSKNVEADAYSRKLEEATEWQLNPVIFKNIIKTFGTPDMDLFASNINKQLPVYVSWHPEPESWAVDAFTFNWRNKYFYIFPPFSLIGKVLAKISREQTRAILVLPDWPSQHWYPRLKKMAVQMIEIKPRTNNLQLAHNNAAVHPLSKNLKLLAIKVTMKLHLKYLIPL